MTSLEPQNDTTGTNNSKLNRSVNAIQKENQKKTKILKQKYFKNLEGLQPW